MMRTRPAGGFQLPKIGFVREREPLQIIPFSHATLWRKVKTGDFPRPVKLSDRITAWRAEDVRAWMTSRTFDSVS